MSRRPAALCDTPADQPPPSWKRSLSRHGSGPSSAFGSRKYVLEKQPSFPVVQGAGPTKPEGEQRSVRELLRSIPTLAVPPPPDTGALVKEGSCVEQRSQEQQELANRIQQAQSEAASFLEQQMKALTEQQQKAFYQELHAARQMEHAQAQAQLHTFRHQDALVVQACISKAQSEKNEVMHQLEAVVKHERTKITSMESEIKLLRDALKKAEQMAAKPATQSEEEGAAKGQHAELDTMAELVRHHHRSLSTELETMSHASTGAVAVAGKHMDANSGQDVNHDASDFNGRNAFLPVHLQSSTAPVGSQSSQEWLKNSNVGFTSASNMTTQTTAPLVGGNSQAFTAASDAKDPFGDNWNPFGEISHPFASAPTVGSAEFGLTRRTESGALPPSIPVATPPLPVAEMGVVDGDSKLVISEPSAVPFDVSGSCTPYHMDVDEQLCSQVTTPEHNEQGSTDVSPNQPVATMQAAGSGTFAVSRKLSDNPFIRNGGWSGATSEISAPDKTGPCRTATPVLVPTPAPHVVASILAAPNPFLPVEPKDKQSGSSASDASRPVQSEETSGEDFAALFADLAMNNTKQAQGSNSLDPEGRDTFIGGASWLKPGKQISVDSMLMGPITEPEGLDLSLAGCNGSEDSASSCSGINSRTTSAVMNSTPADAPSPKSNAMFEDDFTKLFEERHIKPAAKPVVEIRVNCTQSELKLVGQQRHDPSNSDAYVPVGIPMKSLGKVQLDGLHHVGGLFG